MKFGFLREILSENGSGSSKRVAMLFFCLLFAYEIVLNQLTGKAPSETLQTQLFEVVIICIGAVFGSPLMKAGLPWRKSKNLDTASESTEEKKAP